jgi:hypothetical protein
MSMVRAEMLSAAKKAGVDMEFNRDVGSRTWTAKRNGAVLFIEKPKVLLALTLAEFMTKLTGKSTIVEPVKVFPKANVPMTSEDPVEFKWAPPKVGKAILVKKAKKTKERRPKVRVAPGGFEVNDKVRADTRKFLAWRKKHGLDVGCEAPDEEQDMLDELKALTF